MFLESNNYNRGVKGKIQNTKQKFGGVNQNPQRSVNYFSMHTPLDKNNINTTNF